MIDLNLIKLKNLFDSIHGGSGPTMPDNGISGLHLGDNNQYPTGMNPADSSSDDTGFMSQIAKMFTPREDQFNALTSLAGNMPNRTNFEPSLGRRISAYIAGTGAGVRPAGMYGGNPVGIETDPGAGLKLQESILDDPYSKALNDWGNKLAPLEKTAGLEGQRNTNDRMIGSQMLTNERNTNKQLALNKLNDEKLGQNQQKIDISRAREEAYSKAKTFAIEHPTYKSYVDADKNLVFINPADPTAAPIKSGLQTSDMTDLEKAQFNLQGGLEKIAAQGNEARKTADEKNSNTQADKWSQPYNTKDDSGKDVVAQVNNATGEIRILKTPSLTKIKTDSTKRDSVAQQLADRRQRANQALKDHPELNGYIIIPPESTRDVQLPHSGKFGTVFTDQNKVALAHRLVYGDDSTPTASGLPNNNPPGQTTQPQVGDIKTFPNGNKGKWDGHNWVKVQ